ncbi:type 1 glutamine amidotransferase family protein [uncultured Parabacteroides sp.]|uniref:type 1 glutamine amidotransferase family protein n=1 Tax=uncultured Parabacteroides sp. TaxID=512312 RepID=UPI00262E79D9|nr:type 1 glutamine amidotransferase family protein [uncultured Parabacteroides sp.]
MKKEVLFLILNDYADWEGAFLATSLNTGVMPDSEIKYVSKTVAPTLEEVHSIGGFRTLPDYSFQNMPSDYAALVLIGGMQWKSPEAEQVAPIVREALRQGKIVGAICNAASFMCAHGFLNNVKHTGNTLAQLKLWGEANYTNEAGYVEQQAVSDKNIVTANGTGHLEFTRELQILLQADSIDRINGAYDFYKNGLVR